MFLSIVTRHLVSRPQWFARCLASLTVQTCQDFEHLVIVDHAGRGVAWANAQFARHAGGITGDYVLMLDDDDRLAVPEAVALLRDTVTAAAPDIVVFRGQHSRHGILPDADVWERGPVQSHISGQNVILRRAVWQRHIGAFAQPACGDYHLLAALWGCGYTVTWLDRLLVNIGQHFGGPE